jgi:hypothetical protein
MWALFGISRNKPVPERSAATIRSNTRAISAASGFSIENEGNPNVSGSTTPLVISKRNGVFCDCADVAMSMIAMMK